MKNLLPIAVLICSVAILSACTKKVDSGDFDKTTWQSDKNGCNGDRANMIDELMALKPNLLGHYQKRIIAVLGDPEEQELYKRSQTYYIYYIDPAAECANAEENPRRLEVRFTALGIANEVNIK